MSPDQSELTELQQAYWLGERAGFELAGVAAHGYVEFDIADCDARRLQAAIDMLVARHPMLRAQITEEGQVAILDQAPRFELEVGDLRRWDADEARSELERVRDRMTHKGSPSHTWPLFDFRLTRMAGSLSRLHISVSLILADAHGWAVLQRELYQLYTNPNAQLEPIERRSQYGPRLAALRSGPEHDRALAYWRERMPTLPPAPDLPVRSTSSSLGTTRFTVRTRQLRPSEWLGLETRAKAYRVTPTVVLAAAYADVLAAYSKRNHFCINVLVSLRERIRAHGVIDNLSDTLLLEVRQNRGTFQERTAALSQQLIRDLHHSSVGGVEVIREAARLQGSGMRATMPIVFSSELLDGEDDLPGWTKVHDRVQTPHVLIDYQARLEGRRPVLHWEAMDEAFPPGLVGDMFSEYCDRVVHLGRSQSAWSSSKSIGATSEQIARRKEVNATQRPLSEELLHSAFEARAAERPDAVAVISDRRKMTYRELLGRSRQVARWLRDRGASPGTLVAVIMERGWEQIVAVLGTLQAGAAYLPLDPGFPAHRIAHILERASVRLVLTQGAVQVDRSAWPAGAQDLIVDQASDQPGDTQHASIQQPDDLAYVIYTSGSTGSPKGVAISHRGAVNTVRDINERFAVGPDDRVLALSQLNFDLSVYDIFGLLGAGGTIVIPPANRANDPGVWLDLVLSNGVTIWNSVPTYMQMLAEHPESRAARGCPSLRLVMMSGDWIPVTLPEQIRTIAPKAQQISLGGATEASIWSIYYPIEGVDPEWKSIPYGRPLENQWLHVLDDELEHRPDWVPGHLYIGGTGLAVGYWGDQTLTDASFIHHPVTHERLYRTGDWGRYLPSGDIEFLGREDGQVKVRGFRIELGEIETVLRTHKGIREAIVLIREHQRERQLVAYLVTNLSVSTPSPSEFDAEYSVLDSRQRLQARAPFARRAIAECDGCEFEVDITNLSTGGVGYLVVTELPLHLRPGTPIRIRVELDNAGTTAACLAGVVAWSRDSSGGIRFEGAEEVKAVEETVHRIIEENELSLQHLRRFVQSRLPHYMVPSMFVLLDSLPLSANGKVDRRQLPALEAAPAPPREYMAPQNATERGLVEIWEELLGRWGLGVTDNFFELGGHSMLALRMLGRIQKRFGMDLQLATLFEHPTIGHLAQVISGPRLDARSTPMVSLRTAGTEPPLFCVHPSGGNVMCYMELVQALDEVTPVFGMQAEDPGKGSSRGRSCEEMASEYVTAMRGAQPQGPYRIAGWSMGGVVAFEMARQLRDAKQDVALLALFDSWAPALITQETPSSPRELLFLFARDLFGGRQEDVVRIRALLDSAKEENSLTALLELGQRSNPKIELDEVQVEQLFRIFSTNLEASSRYRPRELDVPVLLFRSIERAFDDFADGARFPSLGWDSVVSPSRIEVEQVPGNHYTILRSPTVWTVAAKLSSRLAQLRGR